MIVHRCFEDVAEEIDNGATAMDAARNLAEISRLIAEAELDKAMERLASSAGCVARTLDAFLRDYALNGAQARNIPHPASTSWGELLGDIGSALRARAALDGLSGCVPRPEMFTQEAAERRAESARVQEAKRIEHEAAAAAKAKRKARRGKAA